MTAIAPPNLDSRPRLALALTLSLLTHAAIGVYWVSGGFAAPPRSTTIRYPDKSQSQIRLGIQRSSAQTLTWLGFETPERHAAEQSEVEQAALAPVVGQGGEGGGEAAEGSGEGAGRGETGGESELRNSLQIVDPKAVTDAVRETGESVSSFFEISRNALLRALEAAAAEANAQTEAQAEALAQTQTEADGGAAAGAPGAGERANQSESESIAVSIQETLEVRPGKPAAVEGLEITTVRPRWNVGTRLTANPRNPVVKIVFGRDGAVRDAAFNGGGTGFSSVDEPLLDAIYSWTAKGEKLDALPDREEASITINMRILLR